MDPLSQFALGGLAGAAFGPRVIAALRRAQQQTEQSTPIGPAILCAGLAAMTPDLDILVRDANYPLLSLKYHRHFTHALALAPLWAALVTPVGWLLFRRAGLGWLSVFVLALLGIATHGPLDAMTNYGTHLWWPFTNVRESWSIISIIDPIFTLTILLALVLSWRWKSSRPALVACVFALAYWGAGLYQRTAAEDAMQQLAASRGHTVERYEVKPAFGNLLLWRAQYVYNGAVYTDAINTVPGLPDKVYQGGQQPLQVVDDAWLARFPPAVQQDIRDFAFFSDGWLSPVPGRTDQIGDVRFAMLPNQSGPLWAVDLAQTSATGHALFVTLPRDTRQFDVLWNMITRRAD